MLRTCGLDVQTESDRGLRLKQESVKGSPQSFLGSNFSNLLHAVNHFATALVRAMDATAERRILKGEAGECANDQEILREVSGSIDAQRLTSPSRSGASSSFKPSRVSQPHFFSQGRDNRRRGTGQIYRDRSGPSEKHTLCRKVEKIISKLLFLIYKHYCTLLTTTTWSIKMH